MDSSFDDWFGISSFSIDEFPPTFQKLKEIYAGFRPEFESHRASLEDLLGELLTQIEWDAAVIALNNRDEKIREVYVQRLFYRSCVAFYRFFDLFLAYLTVDRSAFKTWGEVTGYYSRFYFIHAWLNLLQSSWVDTNDVSTEYPDMNKPPKRSRQFFIYDTGSSIQVMNSKDLKEVCDPPNATFRGSHQIWWALLRSVGEPESFEFIDEVGFTLEPFTFNPQERNLANYSYRYLEGFVELEWFETTPEQMMSHFMPNWRRDRDFTDLEAYFEGYDPETVDVADFYTDPVQILWCSVLTYLRLLSALEIDQEFITAEKLTKLIQVHLGDDYPIISAAITAKIDSIMSGGA